MITAALVVYFGIGLMMGLMSLLWFLFGVNGRAGERFGLVIFDYFGVSQWGTRGRLSVAAALFAAFVVIIAHAALLSLS